MILRRLTVENFRCFRGKHELEFSADPDRNVTLIYGFNGGGKTTLLNAFTWGLYGETTPGLKNPDRLINENVWAEAEPGQLVTARVAVEFEHEGRIYLAERRLAQNKTGGGDMPTAGPGELTLYVTDESGENAKPQSAADGTINAVLPARLRRFVFFDGERDIERLAQEEAYEEIEDAIKTVLGLEVIERGINDLKIAQRRLNRDVKRAGSVELEQLTTELEALEDRQRELREKRDRARRNDAARSDQIEEVDTRLAQMKEARELQEKRLGYEERERAAKQRAHQAREGLVAEVNRDGFTAFISDLAQTVIATYDDKREKKQLPSPVARQFVEDLLTDGECICGTRLEEGTDAHQRVYEYLDRAGDPDVDSEWGTINTWAKELLARRNDFFSRIHERQAELDSGLREAQEWADKASEIKKQVEGLGVAEIQAEEQRRDQLIAAREADKREVWECERDLQHLEKEISAKGKELAQAEAANEEAKRAQRRATAAREATAILERILDRRTEEERQKIDERLREVFGRICMKNYVPELTEGFRLTVSTVLGSGEKVPAGWSTGEGQVLSLSFVGAVAERARERYEKTKQSGATRELQSFSGSVFPLVMDGIFGTLSSTYATRAAAALPDLAPQVVVLVLPDSAADAVKGELWPRAGRIYALEMRLKEDRQGERQNLVAPSGTEVPVVTAGADYDHVVITEVN